MIFYPTFYTYHTLFLCAEQESVEIYSATRTKKFILINEPIRYTKRRKSNNLIVSLTYNAIHSCISEHENAI